MRRVERLGARAGDGAARQFASFEIGVRAQPPAEAAFDVGRGILEAKEVAMRIAYLVKPAPGRLIVIVAVFVGRGGHGGAQKLRHLLHLRLVQISRGAFLAALFQTQERGPDADIHG